MDAEQLLDSVGTRRLSELAERPGPAPSARNVPPAAGAALGLPHCKDSASQRLLERRVTCRNWDEHRALPLARLAGLLQSSFAALSEYCAGPGISLLKKPVPSGGGLHPIEAYLLLHRVEGVDDGLTALSMPCAHCLSMPAKTGMRPHCGCLLVNDGLPAHRHCCSTSVVFRRSSWKYRGHSKAYRAPILDVGHLSQTIYLTATEAGLGAFVTAAVNEVEAERAFGLDQWQESPLAASSFGWRGSRREETEFDPLGRVWPE